MTNKINNNESQSNSYWGSWSSYFSTTAKPESSKVSVIAEQSANQVANSATMYSYCNTFASAGKAAIATASYAPFSWAASLSQGAYGYLQPNAPADVVHQQNAQEATVEEEDEFTFVDEADKNQAIEDELTDYVNKHCPGYTLEQVKKLAKEGHALLLNILDDKLTADQFVTSGGNPELAATQLIMCLTVKALKKSQGFEEGTFTIEDQQGKILNFLSQFPQAYNRISSHFKGISPNPHKGFDVGQKPEQMGINTQSHYAMPAEKTTILYSGINKLPSEKQLTFLKPENYGTKTWYDFVMHGAEFVVSLTKKFIPGADQGLGMRKERIPTKALKDFQKLTNEYFSGIINKVQCGDTHSAVRFILNNENIINQMGPSVVNLANEVRIAFDENQNDMQQYNVKVAVFVEAYKQALNNQAKKLGLQLMNSFIKTNSVLADMNIENASTFKKVQAQLNVHDNIDCRFGHEVIFLEDELRNHV